MRIDRTPQGIFLERLLHGMKFRYTLCWNGSDGGMWGSYDCACCITYLPQDAKEFTCGCICHERIEAMANGGRSDIRMFLLALESSKEKPFIASSYEDMMLHARQTYQEHEQWRSKGGHEADPKDCCEDCKLVVKQKASYDEHKKDPKQNCTGGSQEKCFICQEFNKAEKRPRRRK